MDLIRAAEPETVTILGYGGAVGGGKTHFIVRAVISIALAYPGSRILVGRNELNRLRTTTMEEFDRICPPDMVVKKNENDNYRHLRMAHWPEGVVSQVFFRGLDNWQNLGSEQYSAIFIDEASDTSKMVPLMLITRLRHQLPRKVQDAFRARDPQWGMRYFFIAASNPYPGWFTDWFLLKKLDEPLEAGGGRAKIHFIPSKISDNAHNLPPGYEATARAALQAYSPEMAQRFIDGRFDVYPDQVYGEVFDPDIHKWMGPIPEKNDYTRVVGGLDFGGAKPDAHHTAGLVAVITNSNRLIRVAEFKDRGPGVLDRQIAWMLAQQAKWCPQGKKIHWCADRTQGVGINAYQRMGFFITPSIGRPIDQGIVDVARRLAKDSTGLPGSFYLPELIEFENEMQLYRWERDENDNRAPKNKPIKRNDDVIDCDRYMHEVVEKYIGKPEDLLKVLPSVR